MLKPDKWLNVTFPLDFFLLRPRPGLTRSATFKVTQIELFGDYVGMQAAQFQWQQGVGGMRSERQRRKENG